MSLQLIRRLLLSVGTGAFLAATPLAADVEDDLRARIRGRAAILRSPVSSECTEHFTDNDVVGRLASGRGPVALPAGELATVDNVHVGWTRFDVNLSLVVPYRVTIVDGPFTLFEHRVCRIQLNFDVPREVRKDLGRAEETVLAILELHDGPREARGSELWNGRAPEALPADSEATWAEYRIWKAAQVNVEIRRRIDQVLSDAQATMRSMSSDAEYLESFALGVASRRYESVSGCDSALSATFYVSGSEGKSRRGYEDGQRLAWSTAVVRALNECFVDVVPNG